MGVKLKCFDETTLLLVFEKKMALRELDRKKMVIRFLTFFFTINWWSE